MALSNTRCAWVNRSSTTFPVYDDLVHSSIHTGGVTAGGNIIGHIYPNEFYTLIPNDSFYITSFEIIFRNGNGQQVRGYIETSPGYTLDDYGWVAYQEPYHYYNSNGSTLVTSATENIGGTVYRIFTVNKSARTYRSSDGKNQGTLPIGTKLATLSSTTGQSYGGYMIFYKKKLSGGSWQNLVSADKDTNGKTYGFVDLGLPVGTMPNSRPIW